ncbi:Uncharacterized protein TCM_038860 [Theobroma cacao]|uniref:Uncharacterized protein n=1 Tax=Theobroma cacao TaxID=3641 RepID=A0A061GQS6_THECC|nr:Uncharacterized protein TCM_038860 [Theobroma cacao]
MVFIKYENLEASHVVQRDKWAFHVAINTHYDDCRVNKGVEQGVGGVGNPKAIGKEISGEEPTGADSPTGGDLPQMVVYIPHARAHLLLRPYSIFAT